MNLVQIDINAQRILEEANKQQGKEPSQDFIAAFNANGKLETQEERHAVRLQVLESLDSIGSMSGAGLIGIWLGGSVENGADPEPYIPYLLPQLIKMMKQLTFIENEVNDNQESVHQECEGEEDEEHEEEYKELAESLENQELDIGLEYLGQALVAHVSRSDKYRAELPEIEETMVLLDEYSAYSVGVTWLYELLIKHSDDLIVIHVDKKVGVKVRYKNLSNCFHFFTLFQECVEDIIPHDIDDILDEEVDDASDEEIDDEMDDDADDVYETAWWHYGQGDSPEADIMSSVWGEMTPKGISVINGEQVLLLWPHIMASRSWDDGFFHPLLEAAPASVDLIKTLSDDEVKAWFKQLNLDY